jgi:hypothetical protein
MQRTPMRVELDDVVDAVEAARVAFTHARATMSSGQWH